MSMERAIVASNIGSCDLFSLEFVADIENVNIIQIIQEDVDDNIVLIKNIIHLFRGMYMTVVVLSTTRIYERFFGNDIHFCYSYSFLRWKGTNHNMVVIVVDYPLCERDRFHLLSTFNKIIVSHRFCDLHSYSFCKKNAILYFYKKKSFNKINSMYHHFNNTNVTCIKDGDLLLIKNKCVKICQLMYPIACITSYNSREHLLQTIKKIANDKCVYCNKYSTLYSELWQKYYFLSKCHHIWLILSIFSDYSKDILSIVFDIMLALFNNACISVNKRTDIISGYYF